MPKITRDEDELEEEDDESQFDEEELEEKPIRKPLKKPTQAPSPAREGLPKNMQPQAPKRRFGVIPAQPVRIVDAEGQEVIGEGEYLIAQALTDILERLERIENTLGSMTG